MLDSNTSSMSVCLALTSISKLHLSFLFLTFIGSYLFFFSPTLLLHFGGALLSLVQLGMFTIS